VRRRKSEREKGTTQGLGVREQGHHQALTTILLVEDDKFVREATCQALCSAGFRVLTSNNAGEAVQMFRTFSSPCDVLITDIVLPDRRGGELAKQLLILSPALKIIYVSGYPEGTVQGRTDEGGHLCYLQKPFSVEVLLERIRQVRGKDSARDAQSAITPACGKP